MDDRHNIDVTLKLVREHSVDQILVELTQITGMLELIKHPKRNRLGIIIISPDRFSERAYVIDKGADLREIAGLAHTALMR